MTELKALENRLGPFDELSLITIQVIFEFLLILLDARIDNLSDIRRSLSSPCLNVIEDKGSSQDYESRHYDENDFRNKKGEQDENEGTCIGPCEEEPKKLLHICATIVSTNSVHFNFNVLDLKEELD